MNGFHTQVCKQTCMRNTARVLVLCGNVEEFLLYEFNVARPSNSSTIGFL